MAQCKVQRPVEVPALRACTSILHRQLFSRASRYFNVRHKPLDINLRGAIGTAKHWLPLAGRFTSFRCLPPHPRDDCRSSSRSKDRMYLIVFVEVNASFANAFTPASFFSPRPYIR